jgi:hypothetical protein
VSSFKRVKGLLIVLAFLLLALPAFAWRKTWSKNKLFFDGILGIEAIEGFGPTRLLVWGKNYEKAEARVVLAEWQKNKNAFKIIWQSENFYARGSNLMCAVGNFSGDGLEVVILTDNRWGLYNIEADGLKEKVTNKSLSDIWEVAAGDTDGDGISELILTSVAKLHSNTIDKKITVYKFTEGNFVKQLETEGLGNIRAITTCDIDNDGLCEIVYEYGLAHKQGKVVILKDYQPLLNVDLRRYPIYALAAYEDILLVGDESGSINLYKVKNDSLELVDNSVSVGWGLVDTVEGDFFGKGKKQILVVSSPAAFHILED